MTTILPQPAAAAPALVLASASPRRRVMLAAAGVPALVRATDLPEVPRAGEAPVDYACRIAQEKALAGRAARYPGDPEAVLGSDTVVTLDGAILGKPSDPAEAASMLRRLSGRTHEVVTAFALSRGEDAPRLGFDMTRVTFRALGDAEIDAYVASGEAADKAGAYGIQGRAGAFVSRVEGAYDTVVGLPLAPVLDALIDAGIVAPRGPMARRLACLRGRIAAACQAVGRSPDEITLIAVSKTRSPADVREAQALGLADFGENYVQEWRDKAEALGEGPSWHFIGHLQSNKAKALAGSIAAVHTIDTASSVAALDRAASKAGRTIDVCVQVNVGGEAQKSGVEPAQVEALLALVGAAPNLRLRGLMTVPPDGPLCETRAFFAELRRLRDARATPERPLPWLSMGMSGDFDQAIAEGATHVRVGTALFGARTQEPSHV
jgi:MAF protein